MSFYRFMMRNYRGTDTPEGDLAHDMELDRGRFPKNGKGKYDGWHKLIREHLEWNNANNIDNNIFMNRQQTSSAPQQQANGMYRCVELFDAIAYSLDD